MPKFIDNGFGPGVIGVASSFLGRYREFDMCLNSTEAPRGTETVWSAGCNVARHFNHMVQATLDKKDAQWLWILGDDHAWDPGLLMRLLERKVDVVVPLCLQRASPFRPVIHNAAFAPVGYEWLKDKTGILNVTHDLRLGNAGMLIRREVLEKVPAPWFECGRIVPDLESSDLLFSFKAVAAGFDLHLDCDNRIGHITHAVVWPKRRSDGEWTEEICAP